MQKPKLQRLNHTRPGAHRQCVAEPGSEPDPTLLTTPPRELPLPPALQRAPPAVMAASFFSLPLALGRTPSAPTQPFSALGLSQRPAERHRRGSGSRGRCPATGGPPQLQTLEMRGRKQDSPPQLRDPAGLCPSTAPCPSELIPAAVSKAISQGQEEPVYGGLPRTAALGKGPGEGVG